MSAEHHGMDLLPIITLLAVAVIAAPLFKRLGLGAVLMETMRCPASVLNSRRSSSNCMTMADEPAS